MVIGIVVDIALNKKPLKPLTKNGGRKPKKLINRKISKPLQN